MNIFTTCISTIVIKLFGVKIFHTIPIPMAFDLVTEIKLSGLKKNFIAEKAGISPSYLSLIIKK